MRYIKFSLQLFLVLLIFSSWVSAQSISSSRQTAITKAVSICSPAVVGINVIETKVGITSGYSGNMWLDWFYGPQRRYQQYQVSGGGSGFLISSDGYILTNHHVAGNASKVVITTTNGEKYDAEIVGTDIMSDVCLLKISGKNLPFLKFANSDEVLVGEWSIAMGNPFGLFEYNAKPVVTVGVVSNTGISFVEDEGSTYRVYKDMIQTDASISSGNSGGPLLNALGEVIGMNTIIFTTTRNAQGDAGSIGIGFAVPINRIRKVVDILKKNGEVKRNLYVGMSVSEIDAKTAKYYGLEKNEGILVYQIETRSAAHNAGIEVGDIIESINGRRVLKSDDLILELGDATVDDKLVFEILRGKRKVKVELTIPPVKEVKARY